MRLIVIMCTCLSFFTVNAQVTSIAAGSWNTPGIWSGGVVPGPGDDVIINNYITIKNYTASANSVTIQNSATNPGKLELQAGATLNVLEDVVLTSTHHPTDLELYLNSNSVLNILGSFSITREQTFNNFVRLRMIGTSKMIVAGNFDYLYHDQVSSGETQNEITIGNGSVADACYLRVNGDVNLTVNSNSIHNLSWAIANQTTMLVSGNLNMYNIDAAAGGGGGRNELLVSNQTAITIDGNINMYFLDASAITAQQTNSITLSDASTLSVSNVNMTSQYSSGHRNNGITLNNTSSAVTNLFIKGDVNFLSSVPSSIENNITANNSAAIDLKGKILNTPQGSFTFLNDALLKLTGAVQQNLPNSNFRKLEINNTSQQMITLSAPVSVGLSLSFLSGVIQSTATNTVTLESAAITNEGNANSFVSGPILKKCSTINSDIILPIGKNAVWAPIKLSGITGANTTTIFKAEYFDIPFANRTADGMVGNVSNREYWNVTTSGTTPTGTTLTLYWEDACFSGITSTGLGDVFVSSFSTSDNRWHYRQSTIDVASQSCNASTPSLEKGSASISNFIDAASPGLFTFGFDYNEVLPIELEHFTATLLRDNTVTLHWRTLTEFDNSHYIVERSSNAKTFESIGEVRAAGSSLSPRNYSFLDLFPLQGRSYYRIRQVDFDDTSETSEIVTINNSQKQALAIFPNPVDQGVVSMFIPDDFDQIEVQLNDMNSTIVLNATLKRGSDNMFTLFLGEIKSSIYTVTVKTLQGSYRRLIAVKN